MPQDFHKTKRTWVLVDVDEGVVDLVEYLQTIPDVATHASCQGTIGEGGPNPYRPQVMVTWDTPEALARLKSEFDWTEPEGEAPYSWMYIHPKPEWKRPQSQPTTGAFPSPSEIIPPAPDSTSRVNDAGTATDADGVPASPPPTEEGQERCSERWETMPYSSDHIFQAGLRGEPTGQCSKCGKPYLEWADEMTRRAKELYARASASATESQAEFSAEEMLDWLDEDPLVALYLNDIGGWTWDLMNGKSGSGDSFNEAISSAMLSAGLKPKPRVVVTMAELRRILFTAGTGWPAQTEAGIRAVLDAAKGKEVIE